MSININKTSVLTEIPDEEINKSKLRSTEFKGNILKKL